MGAGAGKQREARPETSAFGPRGCTTARYWRERRIGAGAKGCVSLVQPSDGSETKLVAKQMNIPDMSEQDLLHCRHEIQCLAKLSHPNIIRYVEDFVEGGMMYIVMEYADCGDLERQIQMREHNKEYFQESGVVFMFLQLAIAVDHVHSKRMLHRDIKTANVFATSNGLVKLGDFGLSKDYEETVSNAVADTICGTPNYLPPELWRAEKYSKKADVWGLGIVLYELCALRRPFVAVTMKQLRVLVLERDPDPLPDSFGPGINHLSMQLLAKQTADRPTTRGVFMLQYVQDCLGPFIEVIEKSPTISADAKGHILADAAALRTPVEFTPAAECSPQRMSSVFGAEPLQGRLPSCAGDHSPVSERALPPMRSSIIPVPPAAAPTSPRPRKCVRVIETPSSVDTFEQDSPTAHTAPAPPVSPRTPSGRPPCVSSRSGLGTVLREGHVSKKSDGEWKDRYLRLTATMLVISESKGEHGKGLPLAHIRSVHVGDEDDVFAIENSRGQSTCLRAKSLAERTSWVDALQSVLASELQQQDQQQQQARARTAELRAS